MSKYDSNHYSLQKKKKKSVNNVIKLRLFTINVWGPFISSSRGIKCLCVALRPQTESDGPSHSTPIPINIGKWILFKYIYIYILNG